MFWFFTNSWFLNISLVFGVFVFCIYKYLTYYYGYWEGKGIPIKQPSYTTGIFKVLSGELTPGKMYKDTYKEFPNDKFVGGFLTRIPELLIRDPDMIKCVLVKDFNHFMERNREVTDDVEVLNCNLFTAHGAQWRGMRQKMTPAFTSGKLKYMFPLIVEKAESFQKFLAGEVAKSEDQEVKEIISRFTTDIIGSVAFGVQMGSIDDIDSPFRVIGRKIFETSTMLFVKIIIRVVFPALFVALRMRIVPKECEVFFINTVKEIVEERVTKNIKRNDFIDLMLELRGKGYINVDGKDGEEHIEFTDIFMAAQAFVFFVAGFETSSAVMSFALYELAKYPDIQTKLIEEIDEVLERHHGKLSYDSIIEMEYLECVVHETMRMYPALGHLTRMCVSKYTFPDSNLTIDEGTLIAIPALALHYDSQYYPEPRKFIPERFTAEEKRNRHPMVFLPFGEGPRNCIGSRFGKMQSMIGLASILSKFTVHKSTKTEEKLPMNSRSFVTSSLRGVWLKLKPRNDKKEN